MVHWSTSNHTLLKQQSHQPCRNWWPCLSPQRCRFGTSISGGVELECKLDAPVRPGKNSATLKLRSVDNSPLIAGCDLDRCIVAPSTKGAIMAKRRKASKVQKRAKLRRGNSAKRGKSRRISSKAAKRAVARAKPKRAPVKKAARKVKQPITPVVETVAVEVIEQLAPGVIAVTEVEETRQVS
jgi:hypothetical protein